MTQYIKLNGYDVVDCIEADAEFIATLPQEEVWVENTRGMGIGCKYNKDTDQIAISASYNSWVFNEESFKWEAPIAHPEPSRIDEIPPPYRWAEKTQQWVKRPLDGLYRWGFRDERWAKKPDTGREYYWCAIIEQWLSAPEDGLNYRWDEEVHLWRLESDTQN